MTALVQNQPVALSGRLGADPRLGHDREGKPVASFSLAHTPRIREGDQWVDGETVWFQVSAWGEQAEHVKNSLHKGDEVTVLGKQTDREFDRRDGGKAISHDVNADFVAASLRWADVAIQRVERSATPSSLGSSSEGASIA
jgi:single-strand DNA-binding protein